MGDGLTEQKVTAENDRERQARQKSHRRGARGAILSPGRVELIAGMTNATTSQLLLFKQMRCFIVGRSLWPGSSCGFDRTGLAPAGLL